MELIQDGLVSVLGLVLHLITLAEPIQPQALVYSSKGEVDLEEFLWTFEEGNTCSQLLECRLAPVTQMCGWQYNHCLDQQEVDQEGHNNQELL